jgi:hypothetical protein
VLRRQMLRRKYDDGSRIGRWQSAPGLARLEREFSQNWLLGARFLRPLLRSSAVKYSPLGSLTLWNAGRAA